MLACATRSTMRGWKQWNGAERTALIAAGLGIVGSLFMPWATVLGASLYGFEGDGIITAIITDKGVARPPFIKSLKKLTTDNTD